MFWVVVTFLLAASVLVMVAALRASSAKAVSPDVEVYRDQLKELERDTARGTLSPEEAETARVEVARRLLAADRAAQKDMGPAGSGARWIGAVAVSVPTIGIALVTYYWIGAPGYADLPLQARIEAVEAARAERPGQAVAEAEVPDRIDESRPDILEMAGQLRTVLADRPNDLRGWRLAVDTEGGLGNLEAAWRAQDRVVAILGDDAEGGEFAVLAELMILAAGGYVSPEAEQALEEALRRDPLNGSARYYLGLMYAQGGRPDLAWPIWRRLVGDSLPDDPWLIPIYDQIERVSSLAGDPTPLDQLPLPRGSSTDDIEAAGELTLDERMAMIAGMVDGLATRLAGEGGPAGDWGRLITAYGVLGRIDAAAAVYEEAKLVFAEDPAALDILSGAADRAGLVP
ncbi:MAG: c-type cytochrome biogenesis protein CcmI [Pseudomonadota bacterium]